MAEPKYKVGDKVRIQSLEWHQKEIESEKWCPNIFDVYWCSREMTISKIVKSQYLMEEDGQEFSWTDEMIEGLVEEETKPKFKVGDRVFNLATKKSVNIIKWDEETGLYIIRYDDGVQGRSLESELKRLEHITWDDVKEETKSKDMGEVSDGYHTFNELYEYRMLYNAALFNEFAKQGLYDVHKSRKHSDGEYPFGDSNWFIVMAELPTGQISNHYEMKDWDKFQIPEKPVANKWDEHSPRDVADRLTSFTNPKKEYPKTYEECCKVLDFCGEYFFTTYEDGIHLPENDNIVKIHQTLKSVSILTKLLICRNAYWKIAGEEMGLGKPWEPDYKNPDIDLYVIINIYNRVEKAKYGYGFQHCTFTFPTPEMRDAFYENFKVEIESCKELL